jgi:hypothetical protein
MKTTRTIIAIIDNASYTDDGATPERIVEVTTAAAEMFYANRDDVQEFRVIERRESYRHVNLPEDYNAMEDREIRAMAWCLYCNAGAP